MKKLLRNSLIASVVAVAGAAGFAGEAKAQNADVDFTGTVGNVCTITKDLDGTMAINPGNNTVLDARDGTPGEITVNCNTTGTIEVGALSPQSAAATDLAAQADYGSGAELWETSDLSGTAFAATYIGTSNPAGNSGPVAISPNGVDQKLYVSAFVRDDSGTAIPAGTYDYTTTITVTADQ